MGERVKGDRKRGGRKEDEGRAVGKKERVREQQRNFKLNSRSGTCMGLIKRNLIDMHLNKEG